MQYREDFENEAWDFYEYYVEKLRTGSNTIHPYQLALLIHFSTSTLRGHLQRIEDQVAVINFDE